MTDDTIRTTVEVDESPWRSLKADAVGDGVTISEKLGDVLRDYYAEESMPAGLADAMGEESDACPECGAGLVHEMGSEGKRCPGCGWSE